jgi:UDP-galactopyranose mutase
MAETLVFTGKIDDFYHHRYGELQYRSLRFEHEVMNTPNFQGIAIMNFTDEETPFTRIVEHKHFEMMSDDVYRQPVTVISREYPQEYKLGANAYYPVNDESNNRLYEKYHALTEGENRIIFGGRLAEYKYYDMDDTIARAMMCWDERGSSHFFEAKK